MAIIGIDLGATKIAGALFTGEGDILKKVGFQLNGREGTAVGELVRKLVSDLLYRRKDVVSIGICVPGIAGMNTGKIWAPNIPGWEQYPLRQEIEEHFRGISVNIESDRTCYILGEVWKGAAAGCRNAIFISVGTGIGAGILSDGRIIHGSGDIAGSAGWMALEPPYSTDYDGCGCFEYHASGRGITNKAVKLAHERKWYRGPLLKKNLSTGDVFEALKKGDEIAREIIDKAIKMWGMAAANFISLLDPETIIFGGGVFGPAVQYLHAIVDEARNWAQPVSMKNVRFSHSMLGGEAGMYGAGYVALKGE